MSFAYEYITRIKDKVILNLLKHNVSSDLMNALSTHFKKNFNAYKREMFSSDETKLLIFLEKGTNFKEGDVCSYKEGPEKGLKNVIVFYEIPVRKTIQERMKIYDKLNKKNLDIENIKRDKVLGRGDYGVVYESHIDGIKCALKLSTLKDTAMDNPFGNECYSWNETNILCFFRKFIKNKYCPNVPLIYQSFICEKTKLKLRKQSLECDTVATLVEYADGNLKSYLSADRTLEELLSCLFQISAGVRFIQKHGQLMNYDIKQENILYYNIKAGGHWKYVIDDEVYYVPNHGKIFIINDFGISRSMSPSFQMYKTPEDKTFRLGLRYAIVIDDKFSPLISLVEPDSAGKLSDAGIVRWLGGNNKLSTGAQFRMLKKNDKILDCTTELTKTQREYLKSKNITTNPMSTAFFEHPDVIPPFEFYNDTQDVIRMFTGGKRTTQSGHHGKYKLHSAFVKKLREYECVSVSSNDGIFDLDPKYTLMKYFISSFFKDVFRGEYKHPIEEYNM
jgi:serine/threonine protein kinase